MPRDVIGSGLEGGTVVSLEVKTIQPTLKPCVRPVSTPLPPPQRSLCKGKERRIQVPSSSLP